MNRYTHLDPAYLPIQLEVMLMTWEEITYTRLDRMGGEEGQTARELIAKAYEEGRRGGAWYADRIVVVGRKPFE